MPLVSLTFPSAIVLLLLAGAALFFFVGFRKTKTLASGAEQLVPQAGTRAAVPGGAIHFLDIGPRDGQVLVLIHGLGGYLQHFTYALAPLLKDDFRLIVLDRPGCGYSERDGEDKAGLAPQAQMIWALLDSLKVERPVLVGHSLGGAISLAMALQRPGDVKALALLAPLTHEVAEPSPAFAGLDIANATMRALLAHSWAIPGAQSRASETLRIVFEPDTCPDDFLDRGGAALGLRPKGFLSMAEDFRASNRDIPGQARRYAKSLIVPGGILFGDGDNLLEPAAQGAAMQAYGLSFEKTEGHGHMLPITAPETCAAFIRSVIAEAD